MTKWELLKELKRLLEEKGIYNLDGINESSRKSEIQNAIDCLNCNDEQMADYLTVIKLKYPNIYNTVTRNNYLVHKYNRLYVYNTARLTLA